MCGSQVLRSPLCSRNAKRLENPPHVGQTWPVITSEVQNSPVASTRPHNGRGHRVCREPRPPQQDAVHAATHGAPHHPRQPPRQARLKAAVAADAVLARERPPKDRSKHPGGACPISSEHRARASSVRPGRGPPRRLPDCRSSAPAPGPTSFGPNVDSKGEGPRSTNGARAAEARRIRASGQSADCIGAMS